MKGISPIKGISTDNYSDNTIKLNGSNVHKNVMVSNLSSGNDITISYGPEINGRSNLSSIDVLATKTKYIDLDVIGNKFVIMVKSKTAGTHAEFEINAVGV